MRCTAPLQHWQALQKSCIWRANGPKAKLSARAGRKGGAPCQDAWAAGTGAMAAQTSPCLCRTPCCGSWHRACKSPGVTRKEKELGLIEEVFCCHVPLLCTDFCGQQPRRCKPQLRTSHGASEGARVCAAPSVCACTRGTLGLSRKPGRNPELLPASQVSKEEEFQQAAESRKGSLILSPNQLRLRSLCCHRRHPFEHPVHQFTPLNDTAIFSPSQLQAPFPTHCYANNTADFPTGNNSHSTQPLRAGQMQHPPPAALPTALQPAGCQHWPRIRKNIEDDD